MSAKEEIREEKEVFGVYTHKFNTPVEYNGKQFDELSFDFTKLTGADAMNIEDELQAIGKPAFSPAMSSRYLTRMAAKACSAPIGIDIFETMPLTDFEKIKNKARNFLLNVE